MQIQIKSVPKDKIRNNGVGDYWEENDIVQIRALDLPNECYTFLISLHEFIEQYLCKARGISEESITEFDRIFELGRKKGSIYLKETKEVPHGRYVKIDKKGEPGDCPESPYRREHQFATKIEKMMAEELNVNWKEYEKALN